MLLTKTLNESLVKYEKCKKRKSKHETHLSLCRNLLFLSPFTSPTSSTPAPFLLFLLLSLPTNPPGCQIPTNAIATTTGANSKLPKNASCVLANP